MLVVRELESGHVLAQPIADLRFAAYAEETEAQLSVELFVTELLQRKGAPLRAAFSLPQDDITLAHVEVPLPNATALVGRPLSFTMPCVVLPRRRSRWVLVVPLSMTVHVGRGEDLDAVVAKEAERMLAALQPSGYERLGYFCDRAVRLERLELSIERRGTLGGGTKALRKKLDRATLREALLELLLDDDPHHHGIFLAREYDKERALDPWLGQLLDALPRLGWCLVAHVRPDRLPRPPGWPKERSWGPARDAEELAAMLRKGEREPLSVILRVAGRHAGTLLALEAGLHRHMLPRPKVARSTFLLRMLSTTRSTMNDAELDSRCAHLGAIPNPLERKLARSVREVHVDEVRVDDRRGSVDVPRDAYWEHIEAIALTHLLLLERRLEDRGTLFASPLDVELEAAKQATGTR